MTRALVAVSLALLLAACASHPAREAPPEQPVPAASDIRLEALLRQPHDVGPDGSLAVLSALGWPHRVTEQPVPNRHVSGQVDTLRTLVYDALEVEVYAVSGGGELLQEVRVTGPGPRTSDGLGVGSSRTAVRAVLGSPEEERGGQDVFALYEGADAVAPVYLTVDYEGERVAALAWHFYVD